MIQYQTIYTLSSPDDGERAIRTPTDNYEDIVKAIKARHPGKSFITISTQKVDY